MNRRNYLKMLSAAALVPELPAAKLPRFANRKRYFGRFDYSADPILMDPPELWESRGGLCLLNGKPVELCFYANTNTGIVKTYDVLRDSKPHASLRVAKWKEKRYDSFLERVVDKAIHEYCKPGEIWTPEDFPGRDVSCPPEGVIEETIHGEVEIWGLEL